MDQQPVAIMLHKVTKSFGNSLAVHDVTCNVYQGEVFGFLGPNGAGKTTTIRMMLGQISPHDGVIEIFGQNVISNRKVVHRRIGYLGDDMAMDLQLTGMQYLQFIARLRGNVTQAAITHLAERLDCDLHKKLGKLSRGNRQKVGLISALMHDPDLLILDEPTSGFDPLIQAEFNKIVLDRKQRGKTVFISSHILSEVEQLCGRVAFIRGGKLVQVGNMRDLMQTTLKQVRIAFANASDVKHVQSIPGVQRVVIDGSHVSCLFGGHVKGLMMSLSRLSVQDIQIQDVDLEELFLRYYQRGKK